MKIARLDSLVRQDSLFNGGEPDWRYSNRQLTVVDDSFNFGTNGTSGIITTDATTVTNIDIVFQKNLIDYIEYRDWLIIYESVNDFSGLSSFEQEILARNFAVDKADRDTIYTDIEQEQLAIDLQANMFDTSIEDRLEENANDIISKSKNLISVGLVIPETTTVLEGTTGLTGELRYNTDTQALEGFLNGEWDNIIKESNFGTSGISSVNIAISQNRDKYIVVKSESDFPAPSLGVITLEDNTIYSINGTVSIANRLVMGENVFLEGLSGLSDKLVYTGTGDFITATDKTFNIRHLTISVASASKLFNCTDSTDSKILLFSWLIIISSSDLGIISGYDLLHSTNIVLVSSTNGIIMNDINHLGIFQWFVDNSNSGTILKIESGTFNQIQIFNNHIHLDNVSDVGFDINNSVINLTNGVFSNNTFDGVLIPIQNFDVSDNEWTMNGNFGITNTTDRANTTIIRKLSNFPTPVGNTITLLDDHTYDIEGLVNMNNNTLELGNNTNIIGIDTIKDKLVYSGTNSLLVANNVESIKLDSFGISSTTGSAFALSDTSGKSNYIISSLRFNNIEDVGYVNGGNHLRMFHNIYEKFNNGLTIKSDNFLSTSILGHNLFIHDRLNGTGGTVAYEIESGFSANSMKIIASHFESKNINDIAIKTDVANNTITSRSLLSCTFVDYTTSPINGFGVSDDEWLLEANEGVSNTRERENKTIIRKLSNFPTPISNIITLINDHTYEIEGIINLGNNIIQMGNNTKITGVYSNSDQIIYSGTNSLFECIDVNSTFNNIALSSPNGSIINFKNSSGNEKTKNCNIRKIRVFNTNSLGFIENPKYVEVRQSLITNNGIKPNGFICSGSTSGDLVVYDNLIETIDGTFVDLGTSIWDIVIIDRNLIHVPLSSIGIGGLVDDGNLSTSGYGRVSNNGFLEAGTYVNGIDINPNKWVFSLNAGVSDDTDSLAHSEVWVTDNVTETTIVTQTTPTVITTDNWNDEFLSRFSRINGVLTYTGIETIRVSLDATVYFESTNNQDLNFYFAKNGLASTKTKGPSRTQGASETTFANPHGLLELATGDTIEILVENRTSTNNVTITDINWTINK